VQLDHRTTFKGYESLAEIGTVVALLDEQGASVQELADGARGRVILDHTPFYAESGGQAGDTGRLEAEHGEFTVEDTQKLRDAFAHVGPVAKGRVRVGDRVHARVDVEARGATARNHSATHLLHAALRHVLGTHVQQKGSLVAPERLRFDFSHFQPVTPDELATIERLVNAEIRANREGRTRVMAYDEAVAAGAIALFGEKYGDKVRVLSFGEFSTELCGGTHVGRTGDIGLFKILGEGGVAAGVRRIEAVTGQGALDYVNDTERRLRDVAGLVRGSRDDASDKVQALLDRAKKLEREVDQLKAKLASGTGTDLASQAIVLAGAGAGGGTRLLSARLDGADAKALRTAVDQLKEKFGSAVIVLGAAGEDGKVSLVAGVTNDLVAKVKAGEIVGAVATQVGGRGGGRPDFAQAGGTDASKLDAALASVEAYVRAKLG
jgi:alanyl-tRNA synthetase